MSDGTGISRPLAQAAGAALLRRSSPGRAPELAQQLIDAAKISVGSQHSAAHQLGVRYACEDLESLRVRLKHLDETLQPKLQQNEGGRLLTTIAGIGANTAACVIAEVSDPARFESARALAAYAGLCPKHDQSAKRRPISASLTPIGNRRLRPDAVDSNPCRRQPL